MATKLVSLPKFLFTNQKDHRISHQETFQKIYPEGNLIIDSNHPLIDKVIQRQDGER